MNGQAMFEHDGNEAANRKEHEGSEFDEDETSLAVGAFRPLAYKFGEHDAK